MWHSALLALAAVLPLGLAVAADIAIGGDWQSALGAADLTAGAGSDIRSPVDSAATQTLIDISATGGMAWVVRLRRADTRWPAGVTLAVRRTSEGSGPGGIGGGTDWMAVGASDSVLFSGSGERSGIALQFRLQGVSIAQPPDAYATRLTYSVD